MSNGPSKNEVKEAKQLAGVSWCCENCCWFSVVLCCGCYLVVSVSVRYLFYQPMDERIKTWTPRFPAKENPNMEKAFFNWPIVLQYDAKAKYRLISRKSSGVKFFHPGVRLTNQKPRAFVSVR